MIDSENENNREASSPGDAEAAPTDRSSEDSTLESSSLQGEETLESQKGSPEGQSDGASEVGGDENDISIDDEWVPRPHEDLDEVLANLASYNGSVEEMLRWKEGLKVLTLDAILGLPYYDLWRDESNLWFRRSVILKARRKKLEANKKGA